MSNKPPANGEVFTTVENCQMNFNSSRGKDVFSRSKALLEQNGGKKIGKDPVTREDRKNERDATRKRALSNMEKEKALSNTEEEKESKKPRPENGSNESRHCLPFDFHHVLKAMQALTPVGETPVDETLPKQKDNTTTADVATTEIETPTQNDNTARADVATTSIETSTQNDNITTPVDETLPKQKDDTTTADVATTEIETPPKQKEDTTEIETPTQNENTTTADVVDTNDAMTTTSRKYILEQTWMPKEICFIVVCDKCETKLVGTNKKK
ncbi:unnamed protein product [Cylindrotheca closterium]|uniref:Uncharacterized protein n=1 Tax=Cylindrotheca closterium TaxID=2856 RepID=A0AAD2CNN7_9STRA|nr:unnamed protein product [Cylindrotheca closterium]